MRSYTKEIPAFFQLILNNPKRLTEEKLSHKDLKVIRDEFIKIYKDIPNIVDLKKYSPHFDDVLIIGDIHGDFDSVLRATKPFLDEKVKSLIFLGDYVDRGDRSLEAFIFVIILSIIWPERVILLKGNHEDLFVNQHFGFYDDLKSNLSLSDKIKVNKIYQILEDMYDHLSLMAITPRRSVCVHAGIPLLYFELADFFKIPKPHSLIERESDRTKQKTMYDIYMQVRWNDSSENTLRNPLTQAYHGFYFYSESEVMRFLDKNDYRRIVKSHEARRGGYQDLFNGKLIHIFSTEPYFDQIDTAYVLYEKKNGRSHLCNLDFEILLDLEDEIEDIVNN